MRFSPTQEVIERAKALRGEGDLLALSHLAPINRLGSAQADRAQGVIDASETPQRPVSLGHGLIYDPNTDEAFQPDGYNDQLRVETDLAKELIQERNQGRAGAGIAPPASTARGMATDDALLTEMADLQAKLTANPDTFSFLEDSAGDLAGAVYPRAASALQRFTKTDAERDIMERLASLANVVRHGLFGGALTKTEAAEWAKMDPLKAASTEDALRRLQAMQTRLANERANLDQMYSSPASAGTESPAPSGAAPDSQPAGMEDMVEARKTLNGRAYVKIGGQWYEE